jgi:hypothetical protein
MGPAGRFVVHVVALAPLTVAVTVVEPLKVNASLYRVPSTTATPVSVRPFVLRLLHNSCQSPHVPLTVLVAWNPIELYVEGSAPPVLLMSSLIPTNTMADAALPLLLTSPVLSKFIVRP